MAMMAQFLVEPISVQGLWRALLIIPLCLSISIVYKATRVPRMRDLPGAVAPLCVTIVVGMYAVGFGLWLLYRLLA